MGALILIAHSEDFDPHFVQGHSTVSKINISCSKYIQSTGTLLSIPMWVLKMTKLTFLLPIHDMIFPYLSNLLFLVKPTLMYFGLSQSSDLCVPPHDEVLFILMVQACSELFLHYYFDSPSFATLLTHNRDILVSLI